MDVTYKILEELDQYVVARLDLPEQEYLTGNSIWGDYERHGLTDEQLGGMQERPLPSQRIDNIVSILLAKNHR